MATRSSKSDRPGGRGAGRRPRPARPRPPAGPRRPGTAPPPGRGAPSTPPPITRDSRDDLGLNLIWGRNPVLEALKGRRRVHQVLSAGEADSELQSALRSAAPRPLVVPVSTAELTARVGSPDHQEVAAFVDPYPYADPDELLGSHTLLVALDEIQDPHNLGAVIRTAEAVGAGVVIPRHRTAQVSGSVVKASAGATEHASVAMVRNLADFLLQAKEAGFWIYGAAAGTDNVYTAPDYTYPTCFVMGSEGAGLRRRVASLCDVLISLPLVGKVTSLNVSVTAGILLYEAMRQRRAGNKGEAPRPSKEEKPPVSGAEESA